MWRFLEIGINTSHLCLHFRVVDVGQLLVLEAEVVSQADQQDHGPLLVVHAPSLYLFAAQIAVSMMIERV